MKSTILILVLVLAHSAIAAEIKKPTKLSFSITLDTHFESAEINIDRLRADGWKILGDEDEEVYTMNENDVPLTKLPIAKCVGNSCFSIDINQKKEIFSSLGYEDSDNSADGRMQVFAGHPNILEVSGNDNSTWYINGKLSITLK